MPEELSSALVALSGGVDSSLALSMSLKKYHKVRSAYVDISGDGIREEATAVADHLGVDILHVDAAGKFRDEVKDWSGAMLSEGLTPNPCARCNSRIKLALLHEILMPGECLVTGHYAGKDGDLVRRGADGNKDQSYFLSMVPQPIIASCMFPLGDMLKEQVRARAIEEKLPFRMDESMDLCFEMEQPDDSPGNILSTSGEVIGKHSGLSNYTVGQRKGFGGFGRRMYVVSRDVVENTVVIGDRLDLKSHGCILGSINWFEKPVDSEFSALVQTRYRRLPVRASLSVRKDMIEVTFEKSEEAVAPGQVCALYLHRTVIGGGIILSSF